MLALVISLPLVDAASILLISQDTTQTASLESWLVSKGHAVTVDERTTGPGNAESFDLVIVTRETNSGSYDEGNEPHDWNELNVPVICMSPYLMRSSRWGWMNGEGILNLGDLTGYDSPFVNPSHPIVSGRNTNFLSPAYSTHGVTSSLSPTAVEIATLGSGASHGIFVIPPGTTMYDAQGTIAGGLRIGFIRGNDASWDNITANGEQILVNMIAYAVGYSPTLASVGNSIASDITGVSATVGGAVSDTGGATPNITIYYGDNDGGTNAGSWDHSINLGFQSDIFFTGLTGLNSSSTYFYRCLATNFVGDSWASSTATFVTAAPATPPTIVNLPATTIDYELAELNGEVTNTGGDVPQVFIYFGDNDGGTNPSNWDEVIILGTETGEFTREASNLTQNSTYYYRCFATNSGGDIWAPSTATFTTLAYGMPTVVNSAASEITRVSALVGGVVTGDGGDSPSIIIYYGENDGGTDANAWDDSVILPAQNSDFSSSINSLSPSTIYYFRCHAQNVAGVAWASTSESFTTLDFSGSIFINEFMASNDGSYSNYPIPGQVAGRLDDWIELLNGGTTTIDLAGWHLTDDRDELDKWTFPSGTTVDAGDFLIVYASNDNASDSNGNLHTNFKLSAGGEYLALVHPNLTVASEFGSGGTDYPSQKTDVSYGLHPTTTLPVFFSNPTPGVANDTGGSERVGDTKFSVNRGVYSSVFDVVITTETEGASIYYSINGNPPIDAAGSPTASGVLYTEPVHIGHTTILRAAAVKSDLSASNIDTQTYLLMDVAGAGADGTDPSGLNATILEQIKPQGFPDLTGIDSGADDDGDWEMDQSISKSTAQASRLPAGTTQAQALLKGLLDIPTLSIAMDIDDFAGSSEGIYTHATSKGFAWERACSAELIQGDNSAAWQEDCGIRVQGGASRIRAPKHSLSLRFRDEYGAGKLREKVFPGTDLEEFNVLNLRANYNNSWIHTNSSQRDRGSMIRDQWARDTLLEMGQEDGGHGVMAHLYVNGLYMGIHIMGERQDAAHYATYNGGDEDLLDARNGSAFVDGDSTAWDAMKVVVEGGDWSEIQQVLDVDNYIDYQIMNRYAGNSDLKSGGNWRAAGGGPFPTGQPELMAPWKLFSWDAEQTLTSATSTVEPLDPMGLRDTLEALPDYKIRFADRLQKHFFNGGALTSAQTASRWMTRAGQLDRAIIAESARWGDHRNGIDSEIEVYDRDDDWLPHQDWLIGSFFPVRSDNVLNLYRTQGFFPTSTLAPTFNVNGSPQLGGVIPSGEVLSITASSGNIYYTLDGSDPRLVGGGISTSAMTVSSGVAISFSSSGVIRARVLNGGEWSPIMEAIFYLEALPVSGDLAITEINYHPLPPRLLENQAAAALTSPQTLKDNDFEFIEILNTSGIALNLDGVRLGSGISGVLSNFTLAPGARAIVAGNAEAFLIRYPNASASLAGTFSGNLNDAGDSISLTAADGNLLAELAYEDSGAWPGRSDGEGSSLELVAQGLDYNDSESWRPSSEYDGSPGGEGLGSDGRIVINEVLSHADLPLLDSIELYNTTSSELNLTGWYLSDSSDSHRSFKIPTVTIGEGGYATFDESDFNQTSGTPLSGYNGAAVAEAPTTVTSVAHGLFDGDLITISGYGGIGAYNGSFEVDVIDANTFTIDTAFLDDHAIRGSWVRGRPFGLSASKGETLSLIESDVSGKPIRFVDVVDFAAALNAESLGRWPNGAGTGTLVPMSTNTLGAANAEAQVGPVIIAEVMFQPTSSPEDNLEFVEIANTSFLTENLANWRLRGGVDFDFTAAQELSPGGVLIVVGFDPVSNTNATVAFRNAYGIDSSVVLVGPWSDGPLVNEAGTVRLQRADSPPDGVPSYYPQVTEDEVRYLAATPWPTSSAGFGDSLHRVANNLFGNFFTSWIAESPTPGNHSFAGMTYDNFRDITFGINSPTGSGRMDDFDLDGVENMLEYALGMNPKLSDAHLLPSSWIEGGQLKFAYRKNRLAVGLIFQVQQSIDLSSWSPATDSLLMMDGTIETRMVSIPVGSDTCRFIRLKVTE